MVGKQFNPVNPNHESCFEDSKFPELCGISIRLPISGYFFADIDAQFVNIDVLILLDPDSMTKLKLVLNFDNDSVGLKSNG